MKIISKVLAASLLVLALAHTAQAQSAAVDREQLRSLYGLALTNGQTGDTRPLTGWMSWKNDEDPPEAPPRGFYKGKILVVNLWAYWCPNCIAEMGSFAMLTRDIGPDKIQVILVSRPEYWAKDQAFARDHGLPFPLFVVSGSNSPEEIRSAFRDHGMLSLPQTVIYDREGHIRFVQTGGIDWDNPAMLRQIRSYLVPEQR